MECTPDVGSVTKKMKQMKCAGKKKSSIWKKFDAMGNILLQIFSFIVLVLVYIIFFLLEQAIIVIRQSAPRLEQLMRLLREMSKEALEEVSLAQDMERMNPALPSGTIDNIEAQADEGDKTDENKPKEIMEVALAQAMEHMNPISFDGSIDNVETLADKVGEIANMNKCDTSSSGSKSVKRSK